MSNAKTVRRSTIGLRLVSVAALVAILATYLLSGASLASLPLLVLLLAAFILGLHLVGVWKQKHPGEIRAVLERSGTVGTNLGTALISGVLIATAVLVLNLQAAKRASNEEFARETRALRQQTVLALALEDDLAGADLRNLTLRGAFLRGKDFFGADLSGADLREADLSESNLVAANLTGARLEDANLSGVVWSTRTTWPASIKGSIRGRSTFIDLAADRDALVRQRYSRFITTLEAELTSGQTLFAVDFNYGPECGWSPARPTYRTAGEAGEGTPDIDFVRFNSQVNTIYGDERAFMDAKPAAIEQSGGFQDSVAVEPGDELLVRIYFHNDANVQVNGRIPTAREASVQILLPTARATRLCAQAWVSAANARPRAVSDTVEFISEEPVRLAYVEGSARIHTVHQEGSLSDHVLGEGTLIGARRNDGVVPGGFQNDGVVTIRVRVFTELGPL